MSSLAPLVPPARTGNPPIHTTYLRFDSDVLLRHFANVAGDPPPDQRLNYYRQSVAWAAAYIHSLSPGAAAGDKGCTPLGHQIEKDERFWIAAALLTVFHSDNRLNALIHVLTDCLGEVPPVDGLDSWQDALGEVGELKLFFEVNMPAPPSYKSWLSTCYESRVFTPHLRAQAASHPILLEGATKADAMLIAPGTGFAVVFEAKVYSDVSTHTRYNAARNQIARTIDVLLDTHTHLQYPLNSRQPARSCFVLITPELFQEDPTSRLYGSLMQAYSRDTQLLEKHLEHRDPAELAGVPHRLGWVSWERINRLIPGACPWLSS